MSNQTLDELLLTDMGQSAVLRWIEHENRAAGKYKKRGFNAELARVTGFSLSYVGKVLSGKSKATVAFIIAFGKFMGLTESETTIRVQNEISELASLYSKIANDGKQEPVSSFLENMGEWWLHHPERNPMTSIDNLYSALGDEELGFCVTFILFGLWKLPRHEVIDLAYQIRKLTDGDSDKLAVLAADEVIQRSGVNPTTRIKLERIPVELDEAKQEK